MTAVVVPFPTARRIALVSSIAGRALSLRLEAGEEHISRQIDLQARVMRRRGISDALIAREVSSLEAAVRALMWNAVLRPSGGLSR